MNEVVYLACPYTKGDTVVNVHNAFKVAEKLASNGFIPYVPIWFHFWHIISPHSYEFWTKMDLEFVKRCDCVLRTEGESEGADKEVEFAQRQNIPVYYSIMEMIEGVEDE